MTVTRMISINDITPAELAKEFCSWGEDEQAIFFNQIYAESQKWKRPFCFQLQAITDSPILTIGARFIMRQIGEYAEATK